MALTRESVIEGIKKVVDPELGLDIYTLGLIYGIEIKASKVHIKMTLTSPACPFGPQIIADVKTQINKLGTDPEIEMVFDPPWEPSDEVKETLGVA